MNEHKMETIDSKPYKNINIHNLIASGSYKMYYKIQYVHLWCSFINNFNITSTLRGHKYINTWSSQQYVKMSEIRKHTIV